MDLKKINPEDDRKREDDPRRDIKDPPLLDDEPDPTEPEGDPKPNAPPIKVGSSAKPVQRESVEWRNRRTCRICGKLFGAEPELVDHEITIHPNVKLPSKKPTPQGSRDNKRCGTLIRRKTA